MNETPRKTLSSLEITDDPTSCKVIIAEMVKAISLGKKTRARSLAITKLEEASMWLDEELRLS